MEQGGVVTLADCIFENTQGALRRGRQGTELLVMSTKKDTSLKKPTGILVGWLSRLLGKMAKISRLVLLLSGFLNIHGNCSYTSIIG